MKRRLVLVFLLLILIFFAPAALALGILRAANVNVLPVLQSMAAANESFQFLVDYYGLLRLPLHLIFISVVFFAAWLITRISWQLSGWILRATRLGSDYYRAVRQGPATFAALPADEERRLHTMQELGAGVINLSAFVVAGVLAASQFFSLSNLAIIATVAANAFGFAARDYIGDLLNGLSNIFEDRFNVGDNVAIFRVGEKVEGVVERVSVRMLSLRTRGGELINVPQGEVRIMRNYSRGSFSGINVTCRVAAVDLPEAMAALEGLGREAPSLLPDLLEPWTLTSRDGALGSAAEIFIHAKARYGYGAGLRLRVMMLIEERLSAAGVALA